MTDFQQSIARTALIRYLASHPDDLAHYEEDIQYIENEVKKYRKHILAICLALPMLSCIIDFVKGDEIRWVENIILGVLFMVFVALTYHVCIGMDAHRREGIVREAREMMNQ